MYRFQYQWERNWQLSDINDYIPLIEPLFLETIPIIEKNIKTTSSEEIH